MTRWRDPDVVAVGLLAVALVATGPALGLVDLTAAPPELGDGTATVVESDLEGRLAIDRGRFGTGVFYVRPPTATVVVDDVSGTPRLVYRVRVPDLDYDASTSVLLGDGGRHRLALPDRGVPTDRVRDGSYAVTESVIVQSFAERRVVDERTTTAEVRR